MRKDIKCHSASMFGRFASMCGGANGESITDPVWLVECCDDYSLVKQGRSGEHVHRSLQTKLMRELIINSDCYDSIRAASCVDTQCLQLRSLQLAELR